MPQAGAPRFESIPQVIDSYPERFRPEKAEGVDGVVQLHFTGEGGGAYQLKIQDQQLDIEEGEHPDPTMTATVAAEDWIALNNGEVNPMSLVMRGRLTFSGSLPMAMRFRNLFETYA